MANWDSEQGNLFTRHQLKDVTGSYQMQPGLDLTAPQLLAWQAKIYTYQQTLPPPPSQISLFANEAPDLNQSQNPESLIESLDPFTLPQQNTEFWRWQAVTPGQPALYFVIDYHWPLLLYVGETLNDQQRWKGEHGCKRYLQNYVSSLRAVALPVVVGISFWPGAAATRKQRQAQEQGLIQYWRSPFNKENWQRWQTPFIV